MTITGDVTEHWTDDEDLLARYVLESIDRPERETLERHLESCARCREAVRVEQVLAAGIKKAGREQLKARLAGRIAAKQQTGINWYRMAGIAATVVLLIAIGVKYDWFTRTETQEKGLLSRKDTAAPLAQQAPSGAADARLKDVKSPILKLPEHETTVKLDAGAGDRGRGLDEKMIVSFEKKKEDVVVPSVPGKTDRVLAESNRLTLQVMAGLEDEAWIEGKVIPYAAALHSADALRNLAADNRLSAVSKSQASQIDTVGVIVIQRPFASLPTSQQVRQMPGSVQALFRQESGRLHVTLFSDLPTSPQDLQNAQLQRVRSDSLVLILGQQRIGFRTQQGSPARLMK